MEVDDSLVILAEGKPTESDKRGAFSCRRIQAIQTQQSTAYSGNDTITESFSYFLFSKTTFLSFKEDTERGLKKVVNRFIVLLVVEMFQKLIRPYYSCHWIKI